MRADDAVATAAARWDQLVDHLLIESAQRMHARGVPPADRHAQMAAEQATWRQIRPVVLAIVADLYTRIDTLEQRLQALEAVLGMVETSAPDLTVH
jgi:hypothetical protein